MVERPVYDLTIFKIHFGKLTVSELADKAREIMGDLDIPYQSRQASYDLKKFRAKALVRKIENLRRYETTTKGLKQIAAFSVLRENFLIPLLASGGKRKTGPKPMNRSKLDIHYDNIQIQMQHILNELKIAA